MRIKSLIITLLLSMLSLTLFSKSKITVDKVEPSFWWVGMKNSTLQVMIHGDNISSTKPKIEYKGVVLKQSIQVTSPNYLVLYLEITEETLPGKVPIQFLANGKVIHTINYELKARESIDNKNIGFDPSDVIYLLMPDRFANGDPTIDNVEGMTQKMNREEPYGRHGGDLKGIADHLNYFTDLGVTALWLNPVQENNSSEQSYHGYGMTDLYKVDPRFGTNEEYKALVKACHDNDLKVVMDLVFNHIGSDHWWMNDLPMSDWLNHQSYWEDGKKESEYYGTNYQVTKQLDPYASKEDFDQNVEGWFTPKMPDLNQNNPILADYIIQNTIWWIEYAGLNGIRMDTFGYAYKAFASRWTKEIMEEYPQFNIVGEILVKETPVASYFAGGANNLDGYDSYLPSVTDMPLSFAANAAFSPENDAPDWNSPMRQLANHLTQDYLFPDPYNLVTCLDNHDVNRVMSNLKDPERVKLALTFLLTTRGIPQIYYGTELLYEGFESDHASLRLDFPGGWEGDERSAFELEGRTAIENDVYDYLKNILQWRKSNSAIHKGKLIHYIPNDDVYVYFRKTVEETVMIIINNNEEKVVTIDTSNFESAISGATKGKEIISGIVYSDISTIKINGKQAMILELQ
ncbi:hypothetical protein EI427_05355 [Flammeovirga pectinis]|uniref:Glycosyl hydrolase family 13 catalytic domain-containing protein n=2 Tax=Flammeovirga pectinis TaxID=2494373 RepID=A0A3Q9FPH1_9BACT|nr:hypothetical protein EI427_05355 [Flammeovirga pectinis]